MEYENLKAAYEKAMAECTHLESEIEKKDKTIEKHNRAIEEQNKIITVQKQAIEQINRVVEEKNKTIEEQSKIIEEDKLTIEHLKEMPLNRNKMIFGRKSEKSKYLSPNEQPVFEGGINEAESESDLTMPEPERVKTVKKSQKNRQTSWQK